MRATVMRNKKLVVAEIATPEPGPGEALVKTLACGICGSDLHALSIAVFSVARSALYGFALRLDFLNSGATNFLNHLHNIVEPLRDYIVPGVIPADGALPLFPNFVFWRRLASASASVGKH